MSNLINKKLVRLDLDCGTREEAIVELAKLIHADDRLTTYEEFISEVFDREVKAPTSIGFGIAIPHGKCEAVKVPAVAFGRCNKGIEWDNFHGEPVKIIFLLAVPCEGEACNEHLRILAALSRKLIHEEFTSKLHSLQTEEEIVELLASVI